MNIFEDIERIAPGVAGLSSGELIALHRFTIMWTLFEFQFLASNASARQIKEKTGVLFDKGILQDVWFKPQLDHFVNRYVTDGKTNKKFDDLHLRRGDDPDLVKAVLLGQNKNSKDELSACLIIVYRFRNNFFHGLKWAYGLKEQQENFEQSIELLKNCIERSRSKSSSGCSDGGTLIAAYSGAESTSNNGPVAPEDSLTEATAETEPSP